MVVRFRTFIVRRCPMWSLKDGQGGDERQFGCPFSRTSIGYVYSRVHRQCRYNHSQRQFFSRVIQCIQKTQQGSTPVFADADIPGKTNAWVHACLYRGYSVDISELQTQVNRSSEASLRGFFSGERFATIICTPTVSCCTPRPVVDAGRT